MCIRDRTKSQHDWLERRFENMTVKESLLFRGAMQIERPQMACDVMLIASQLDHYDLFYGAGDDVQLGKFIMEQIQRPSDQAREFLDPEKVGAAYRQKGGNTFCDGHFIKVTSLIDPFLDSDPSMNPDKGDFAIRVKLASRTNMDGVWVGFPDTDEYIDCLLYTSNIYAGALDGNSINDLNDMIRVAEQVSDYILIPNVNSDVTLGRYVAVAGQIQGDPRFPEAAWPYLDVYKRQQLASTNRSRA